ncbi:MAG: glycosyltransferase family 2 protein [Candidatus Margulisbacteria bacterium]|nr:glycosyltransferase family 2 protein [Candidatus Margulisiibacteriota bacterium]
MQISHPKLSIVIVNYNGAKFIQRCLDSILNSTQTPHEIIVIDNQSQDNSIAILKTYETRITLILNPQNVGFAKANNQGFKVSKGDCILLLNNDTIVTSGALDQMVSYLDNHPNVGGLGPRLLNPDGSVQSQGSILNQWIFKSKSPRSVSFLCFAAFLTRSKILQQMGGLDENFFFYNEDIDLCKRFKKQGLDIIYFPESEIIHFGGLSTQSLKPTAIIEGYRGGLYLCQKHYPGYVYHMYRILIVCVSFCLMAWHSTLSLAKKEHVQYKNAFGHILRLALKNDIVPSISSL